MAARCRSLATAVVGVLISTIVQQAGFDLDPVVFAPVEDAVADIIITATSTRGIPTPSLPMVGEGLSATPQFIPWRLFNDVDIYLMLLIFLGGYQLFTIIFDYLFKHGARAPAAVIKHKPTVTVDAIKQLLRSLSSLAIGHVRLWLATHRFSMNLQAALFLNQQQHHQTIEKIHRGYQRLIRDLEVDSTKVMTEMWRCIEKKDRSIAELIAEAEERPSETTELNTALRASYHHKQIAQVKLSDCTQQLEQTENKLSEQTKANATICYQLDNQIQKTKRLDADMRVVSQENSKTLAELRQKIKNLAAMSEGHRSEKSRLSIRLQAEAQAKDQLQRKVKNMDQREAQSRNERNSLQHANNSLRCQNEKIIAEKAILGTEKAKLAEELAALQMQNHEHVITIEKLEKEKTNLSQRVQCVESPEQGDAAPQPFPATKNQEKDKAKQPTEQPTEPASSAGTQDGSTNGSDLFSGVSAGSNSRGRLFGRLSPPPTVANRTTADNPEPSSIIPPNTDNNALSDKGQPIGSGGQNAGTLTSTQDVSNISLDWQHPPPPITSRGLDENIDASSHIPSTSANRKPKLSQGLYVPVHKRRVSDVSSTPKSDSSSSRLHSPVITFSIGGTSLDILTLGKKIDYKQANGHDDDKFPTSGTSAVAATGSAGTTNGGGNTGTYQQRQNRRTNKYRDKKKKAAKETSLNNHTGGEGHQEKSSR
ncbi:MAG: hypothetical protein Q9208_004597 [Pyrenodesmia sp. 3 TL-2023]